MIRLLLISLSLFFISIAPSEASDSKEIPTEDIKFYETDLNTLADHSDLVVRGRVGQVKMEVDHSWVQFFIEEYYKGVLNDPFIWIYTPQGKVRVDESEPRFRRYESAILFVYEVRANPDKNLKNTYRLVNGGYGRKLLIHDNVYIDPENPFQTVKRKEYLKSLIQLKEGESVLKQTPSLSAVKK